MTVTPLMTSLFTGVSFLAAASCKHKDENEAEIDNIRFFYLHDFLPLC